MSTTTPASKMSPESVSKLYEAPQFRPDVECTVVQAAVSVFEQSTAKKPTLWQNPSRIICEQFIQMQPKTIKTKAAFACDKLSLPTVPTSFAAIQTGLQRQVWDLTNFRASVLGSNARSATPDQSVKLAMDNSDLTINFSPDAAVHFAKAGEYQVGWRHGNLQQDGDKMNCNTYLSPKDPTIVGQSRYQKEVHGMGYPAALPPTPDEVLKPLNLDAVKAKRTAMLDNKYGVEGKDLTQQRPAYAGINVFNFVSGFNPSSIVYGRAALHLKPLYKEASTFHPMDTKQMGCLSAKDGDRYFNPEWQCAGSFDNFNPTFSGTLKPTVTSNTNNGAQMHCKGVDGQRVLTSYAFPDNTLHNQAVGYKRSCSPDVITTWRVKEVFSAVTPEQRGQFKFVSDADQKTTLEMPNFEAFVHASIPMDSAHIAFISGDFFDSFGKPETGGALQDLSAKRLIPLSWFWMVPDAPQGNNPQLPEGGVWPMTTVTPVTLAAFVHPESSDINNNWLAPMAREAQAARLEFQKAIQLAKEKNNMLQAHEKARVDKWSKESGAFRTMSKDIKKLEKKQADLKQKESSKSELRKVESDLKKLRGEFSQPRWDYIKKFMDTVKPEQAQSSAEFNTAVATLHGKYRALMKGIFDRVQTAIQLQQQKIPVQLFKPTCTQSD